MKQEKLWLIELSLPASATEPFMEGLEKYADSMSCFEEDEDGVSWRLQIYTQTKPITEDLRNSIKMLSSDLNIVKPTFVISEVEQIDWVAESQKNFESVEAGKFFVYPSWRGDEVPEEKIAIEIDPQQAFGTGGHETTRGCLLALQELEGDFHNILDMGCGSGILAIAASKLWPEANILAVDNDPVCVETTLRNAAINNVETKFKVAQSEGYNSEIVKENAPYEVITANILALPLIEFAPKAKKSLAAGGYIILAGLMDEHADEVIEAHEKENFIFVSRKDYGKWTILVMRA